MKTTHLYQKEVTLQADRRQISAELIKIISDLWYEKSIEIVLFRNQLIDKNVSEILNLHEYAGAFVGKPISIFHSIDIARALSEIQLPPSKLDLGKLTYEFGIEEDKYPNARYFVMEKLKKAKSSKEIKPKDVVLYGFGRIGRLLARELVSKTGKGDQLRLRAIVVREKK